MAMELLSAAGRQAPGAGGPVSELPLPTWKSREPGGTGGDAGAEQKEAVVGDGVTGVLTPSENEMLCRGKSTLRARRDIWVLLCLLSYGTLFIPPSLT